MPTFPTDKCVLFLTMGDPAGVGPEVIAGALEHFRGKEPAVIVIVGDLIVMRKALGRERAGWIKIIDRPWKSVPEEDGFYLLDPDESISPDTREATTEGAKKAKVCIDEALRIMGTLPEDVSAGLVTAPVSKYHLSLIAPGFTGHTEYLRDFYRKEHVTMALVGEHLNVVPLTRHLPLKEVPGVLTREFLKRGIMQVIEFRAALSGNSDPVIGVCALNPHAGEGGRLGTEERDVIAPVIKELGCEYASLKGPLPADVVFYKALSGEIDIVLGMYHDQCLGPFKTLDFDNGVNMTLGLDHVRTSPDHGTAFDIAWSGKASPLSMINAVSLAVRAMKTF